jgi:hypothetical protein
MLPVQIQDEEPDYRRGTRLAGKARGANAHSKLTFQMDHSAGPVTIERRLADVLAGYPWNIVPSDVVGSLKGYLPNS